MEVWWIGKERSVKDAFWYEQAASSNGPDQSDTKTFDAGHITTGYALGGTAKVILNKSGGYYAGCWHNGGIDDYAFDGCFISHHSSR